MRFAHLELRTPAQKANDLCEQARRWLGRGEFGRVVTLCDEALAQVEDCAEAFRLRAVALHRSGDSSEGLRYFERYIGLVTPSADAWLQQGEILLALGDLSRAEKSFASALSIDPDSCEAKLRRARVLLAKGDFGDALPLFSEIADQRPEETSAWVGKGVCLGERGEQAAAVGCYDRALAIDPKNADALYNRAATLAELSRWQEAAACYGSLLELRPRDVEALVGKAEALLGMKDHEGGLQVSKAALGIDGGNADAWETKAVATAALGRLDESLEACRKGFAAGSESERLAKLQDRIEDLHSRLVAPVEAAYEKARRALPAAEQALRTAAEQLSSAESAASFRRKDIQSKPPWHYAPEGCLAWAAGVAIWFFLMLVIGVPMSHAHSAGMSALMLFGLPLLSWIVVKVGIGALLQSIAAGKSESDLSQLGRKVQRAESEEEQVRAQVTDLEHRLAQARDQFKTTRVEADG